MNRIVIMVGALLVLSGGCDKPAPPPPVQQTAPPPQVSIPLTVPISGQVKHLSLRAAPLAITAPIEWNIDSFGGRTGIDAPYPGGLASIVVTRLQPMSANRTQDYITAATAPSEQKFLVNEFRDIGGLKVREAIFVIPADTTAPSTVPAMINWHFYVLVPDAADFDLCGIAINDVSYEDFQKHRDFFESIINTLRRD